MAGTTLIRSPLHYTDYSIMLPRLVSAGGG